jgi:hypothetical protein
MRNPKQVFVFTLLLFTTLAAPSIFGQGNENKSERVPAGNWTAKFGPYKGEGYESMLVQVVSVEGGATTTGLMSIKNWHFKNHSDKAVGYIEISAFVYNELEPKTIVLQKRVYTMAFTYGQLGAGNEFQASTNARAVTLFAKGDQGLMIPLLKDGTLEGNYRIEFGITKVRFDDGSFWEFTDTSKSTPLN